MGSPTGLLSWAQYEEIRDVAGVEEAYPIAVGYNYKGYRLVGTLPEMFEEHEWSKGKKYEVQEGGRIFTEGGKEALVGSMLLGVWVCRRVEFHPYHGWLSMREAGSRIPMSWSEYWSLREHLPTTRSGSPSKGFSKWKEVTRRLLNSLTQFFSP